MLGIIKIHPHPNNELVVQGGYGVQVACQDGNYFRLTLKSKSSDNSITLIMSEAEKTDFLNQINQA